MGGCPPPSVTLPPLPVQNMIETLFQFITQLGYRLMRQEDLLPLPTELKRFFSKLNKPGMFSDLQKGKLEILEACGFEHRFWLTYPKQEQERKEEEKQEQEQQPRRGRSNGKTVDSCSGVSIFVPVNTCLVPFSGGSSLLSSRRRGCEPLKICKSCCTSTRRSLRCICFSWCRRGFSP